MWCNYEQFIMKLGHTGSTQRDENQPKLAACRGLGRRPLAHKHARDGGEQQCESPQFYSEQSSLFSA